MCPPGLDGKWPGKKHIVFELGGTPDTEKDLLLNTLVVGVFASHISRGISNPNMRLLICCDEAARLVGSSDNGVSDLVGVVRGTGIGLDLSVQSSEVSKAVLSNTPNKFVGRITSYTDLEAVGSSMGLNQDQRRWLSRNLVPGMFVGQLGQGNSRHPFLFRVPPMNLKRLPEDSGVFSGKTPSPAFSSTSWEVPFPRRQLPGGGSGDDAEPPGGQAARRTLTEPGGTVSSCGSQKAYWSNWPGRFVSRQEHKWPKNGQPLDLACSPKPTIPFLCLKE